MSSCDDSAVTMSELLLGNSHVVPRVVKSYLATNITSTSSGPNKSYTVNFSTWGLVSVTLQRLLQMHLFFLVRCWLFQVSIIM